MNTLYAFVSVFLVSLVSLVGIFFLSLNKDFLKRFLLTVVSFAVGALFANVFLHLLPEIVERSNDLRWSFGLVLTGIVLSLIIEKFIHWHHCHNLDCAEHHHKPVGLLTIIGDGVHNMTDGILIASAYLADVELGIATTIAVVLHEIPQEIGDCAVLLHSGMSRTKALLCNFGSGLTAILGAGIVLFLSEYAADIELILLPLAAGNFLYIAGSDLVPELNKETKLGRSMAQLVALLAGVALITLFSSGEHGHGEIHDNHDDHELHEEHYEDEHHEIQQ